MMIIVATPDGRGKRTSTKASYVFVVSLYTQHMALPILTLALGLAPRHPGGVDEQVAERLPSHPA